MPRAPLSEEQILAFLDECLDVEFSFIKSEIPTRDIVTQPRQTQDFILNLTQRMSCTNIELAYQFACSSRQALEAMDPHMVEAWAMTATDNYDQKGLYPAMTVIKDLENFVHSAHVHASGAVFEEEAAILLPFVHGLSGRKLKISPLEQGTITHAYTDTETLFLPPIMGLLEEKKDNFLIYKATVAHLWAQIQFGTFRVDLEPLINEPSKIESFYALEAIRLDACIQRELPGLHRDMQRLNQLIQQADERVLHEQPVIEKLSARQASAQTSLQLLEEIDDALASPLCCYHGGLQLEQAHHVLQQRIEKEKTYFRIALSDIAKEMQHARQDDEDDTEDDSDDDSNEDTTSQPAKFEVPGKQDEEGQIQSGIIELELEGELVKPPEHVRELMTSIIVDFGEIPPEHLYAAGPGEYDLKKYEDEKHNTEDVWHGTYHEEGAEIYNEWNFKRQYYHKNWCVLREIDVPPKYDDFVENTLTKHKGLLKSLRHTFEVLRGENKLLKRQPYGDDIDIDALVEALADTQSGAEMTNRVFTKMHKEERNVAVIFMVDMSGSTKGWINDAERESLILLAEVLEILGDRYAIYGFSGVTRKRCELYKIKAIDEDYDDTIKARISNIQPKDYTRMGVFIRHMTRMFSEIEASTKLLITLSDGKPDDYDTYRGEYGVEDTRQALYEAHRDGIHSFCITIDEKARDYLPHMYGAANYAVIDDVAKLPLKVSDIYRRITT